MVNESVYGDKGTWITYNNNSSVVFPNFNDNKSTLKDGYDNNKIPLNKRLDNSVVHSALGSESALSHLHWYLDKTEFATDEFNATQFCFAFGYNSVAYNYGAFAKTTQIKATPELMIYPTTNKTNLINTPVIDFDYKKLRAVIRVKVQQTKTVKTTGMLDISLKQYLDTYKTSYPYIRQVYINLYEKQGNTFTLLNNKSQCGILIFNDVSLYKPFKKNTSTTWITGQTGAMFCNNVPTQRTPYNSSVTILGIMSNYYANSAVSDRIDSRYVNAFTDGVTVETVQPDPTFYIYETFCYREYDTGFEEYIKRQTACFGIQFVTDESYINIDIESEDTDEETANNVYIGILDGNFIGHGNYVKGKAITKTSQYKLDSANSSPFDPSKEIDPNTYHNTSVKPVDVDGNTSFTTKYVLNYGQLDSIAHDFYNALKTKPEELTYTDFSSSLFLTNNAIDTIISCKYFPFQLPMTGGENVKMGNYTIKVGNEPLIAPITSRKVVVYEFSCGSCFGEFGDFRDYEPYTTYELKIPFCGSVRLNTAECVGKTISVSLAVDIETGSCTGFVYANDELVESVSGSCGVDIAISGIQQSTLDSQIFNASINQRQAKTNAVFSVAKSVINVGSNAYGLSKAKTPLSIVQGISHTANSVTNSMQDISNSMYSLQRANYELSHVQIPYKCVGGVGSGVCLSESKECVLIKETPVMLSDYNSEVYGKTTGFACCMNGTLSTFSGYTVCSDVDLTGINATENEKSMIKQLLCTGVRL